MALPGMMLHNYTNIEILQSYKFYFFTIKMNDFWDDLTDVCTKINRWLHRLGLRKITTTTDCISLRVQAREALSFENHQQIPSMPEIYPLRLLHVPYVRHLFKQERSHACVRARFSSKIQYNA